MKINLLPAIMASMISLSGCASEPTDDKSADIPWENDLPATDVRMSGCEFRTFAVQGAGILFSDQPPGWNSAAGTNVLVYDLLHCHRVSMGPFERGPVWSIWEQHDNFDEPEPCQSLRRDFPFFLSSAIFSDPDLSDYAASELGMPAKFANVSFSESSLLTEGHVVISVVAPSGEEASFEVLAVSSEINEGSRTYGFYWDTGKGIGLLEWEAEYTFASLAARAGFAELGPPFEVPSGSYPLDPVHYPEYKPQFYPIFFGDYQCNQRSQS